MLDKTYDAYSVEQKLYEAWDKAGSFAIGGRDNAEPFTIVIPPPNVTGSLHMGHALNNTLQDILIRRERMRGRDALWQPGTDHAGIATQMVVERMLEGEGLDRRELGRDAFIDRVWTWKAESGGLISRQLRRLGASADWSRERFTMDEGLSKAVLKVFVDLYDKGLIYRDKRLVNWDPKLHTAISDLEVQQQEVNGHLWHFKYPIEGEDGRFIVVATTRPETMLGDTAVAVHPDDERYKDLVGKHAILPLVGRRLPIVADDYADPEQGSGAVKITPAHDFNDFEVGRRHEPRAWSTSSTKRTRVTERCAGGLSRPRPLRGAQEDGRRPGGPRPIGQGRGPRPHGALWRPRRCADRALADRPVVCRRGDAGQAGDRGGRERAHPLRAGAVEKTYFEWMRNIQPWCISRQLWWGHQIPAWYGPDGEIFVEMSKEEASQAAAEAHYGKAVELERDPDVLDTWFSSALWPFSTLGWPDETPELKRYYPAMSWSPGSTSSSSGSPA